MAFLGDDSRKSITIGERDKMGLLRKLFSMELMILVWIPVVAITLSHYFTPHTFHWVHDILRRVYYLPIVIAAIRVGLGGGMAISFVVTLVYIPHAFLAQHHFDPARGLEKALEIALYFVVAGVAGYLSDLERRRRSQLLESLEEQKSLTEQLVRAGRLSTLGEVVAGIAHEIKNPLHSLRGTAEIVDSVIPEDADEKRMWNIHRREIDRLDRVAERFLSFAKPTPVELLDMDLRVAAKRVVELMEADARKRNVTIELDLPDKEVRAKGDLDQLAQIGLNIALNAIKSIGESGGKIKLTAGTKRHHHKEMVSLSIENSGPPIPEEEIEHLFDPFHSRTGGTGLGLSISSRIAEQHGGFLEVERGGLGVIFNLYLPTRV